MKVLNTTFLLALFALTACNKTERTTTEITTESHPAEAVKTDDTDKQEIIRLVKEMYKWKEKTNFPNAFRPFVKDSMIVGYDHIGKSLYIKQLDASGYFAREFLDNMGKIFNKQDELLRNGKAEWHDGDMSPFDGGADQWCNCQDTPDDSGFENINVIIEKMTPNNAELYWNWKNISKDWENTNYHIKAVKENGKWKIARMEGWEYDANTRI